MENIIDVSSFLRKKRGAEAAQDNELVYKAFIRETLDLIYTNEDAHCCINTDGVAIIHMDSRQVVAPDSPLLREPGYEAYPHNKEFCRTACEIRSYQDQLQSHGMGNEESSMNFIFMRMPGHEVGEKKLDRKFRIVINIGMKKYDRIVPAKVRSQVLKAALLNGKYLEFPELQKMWAETQSDNINLYDHVATMKMKGPKKAKKGLSESIEVTGVSWGKMQMPQFSDDPIWKDGYEIEDNNN